MRYALIATLFVSACQTSADKQTPVEHPFIGCWESDDRLSREGWTIDPSGWLVGYAISRSADGNVEFYESMRIERGDGSDVLVVTGADGSTTRFPRDKNSDGAEFRFVNAEHDFPQVIVYRAKSGRLDAEISFLDGKNSIEFLKSACAK